MVLTINSKFRPFSYDELVKPLVQYQQAYEQVEKDYSTLATQAEVWKDIATQENNPVAFAMYQRYSNDLNRLTDDFSQGMNANNRRQLLAMKKRYAAEIAPIARADASMKEANKYRDTVRAKDPSAIFKVSNYTSLDDFLNGNTADNSYISGNQVTARVAARAQAAGTALFNQLKSQGMSDVEAMAVIQSGQHPTLQKIYNEEWEASGAKDFGDEGKLQVQNAIQSGMNNAVAKVAEGEYMTAAQRDASARGWSSINESIRQHNIALKMKGYDSEGNIDPTNPYWRAQGLEYDEETGTWKAVGKPGTNKSGTSDSASSKSGSSRLPRLTNSLFIGNSGATTVYDKGSEAPQGGTPLLFSKLTIQQQTNIKQAIGTDSPSNYLFIAVKNGWFDGLGEDGIVIIPKKTVVNDTNDDAYAESYANG